MMDLNYMSNNKSTLNIAIIIVDDIVILINFSVLIGCVISIPIIIKIIILIILKENNLFNICGIGFNVYPIKIPESKFKNINIESFLSKLFIGFHVIYIV